MKETICFEDKIFARDILEGLTAPDKYISSKYFYNEEGDRLFQAIMNMPEYYLTRCEYEILTIFKDDLLKLFGSGGKPFNLIELGAGDGLKTKVLLRHFLKSRADFKYIPEDISVNALDKLRASLQKELPELNFEGVKGDYFKTMKDLDTNDGVKKVILFLGSNIGNYSQEQAISFLAKVRDIMQKEDLLLIGFDLKKDPKIIIDAYNDRAGITKAFNLNLLARVNNELGADFNTDNFKHYPVYDPHTGEARSYLLSVKPQEVKINLLNKKIKFEAWEPIHTEISKKYSLNEINRLAEKNGFKVKQNFLDCKNYFADSLWEIS